MVPSLPHSSPPLSQVLQRWELTSVRRWAASTNSFTLDFGDYREGYYSVQTAEGELISQLLGSYIDLILRAVCRLTAAFAVLVVCMTWKLCIHRSLYSLWASVVAYSGLTLYYVHRSLRGSLSTFGMH